MNSSLQSQIVYIWGVESHSEMILELKTKNFQGMVQLPRKPEKRKYSPNIQKKKNEESRKCYQFVGKSLDHYVCKHLGMNTTMINLARIKLVLIAKRLLWMQCILYLVKYLKKFLYVIYFCIEYCSQVDFQLNCALH